jgi:hypothetical protein
MSLPEGNIYARTNEVTSLSVLEGARCRSNRLPALHLSPHRASFHPHSRTANLRALVLTQSVSSLYWRSVTEECLSEQNMAHRHSATRVSPSLCTLYGMFLSSSVYSLPLLFSLSPHTLVLYVFTFPPTTVTPNVHRHTTRCCGPTSCSRDQGRALHSFQQSCFNRAVRTVTALHSFQQSCFS